MIRAILIFTLVVAAVLPATAGTAAPRRVEMGIFVVDITDINERAGTFTAEFDVVARWQDPESGFDATAEGHGVRTRMGDRADAFLAEIWSPTIFAVNVVGARGKGNETVTEAADGTITLRSRLRRTVRAPLDFRRFPFDEQVLPVHIESYLYPADELEIVPVEDFSGFDDTFSPPEWRVRGLTTHSEPRARVQDGGRVYHRLSFLVHIERLSGYYLWKIMLPMVIIVMVSWIVFWMSGEMLGRRAGVSSTGMLTVIAYQFVIASTLPRFPYLTVMDYFTLVSLVIIAATMLVNLVVSRLDAERGCTVDRFCRFLFPLGYTLGLAVVLAGGRGA